MHGTELVFILAAIALAFAGIYVLTLWRVKQIIAERQLKIADQLAKLDQAIRALETRLTEHHARSRSEVLQNDASVDAERELAGEEGAAEDVAPEIKAAIAAAAVAVAGPNAQVRSVKAASPPAASPWTQQGRVMVQGSHNLRVRR